MPQTKNENKVEVKLTEKQRTLAIAAGMVGGCLDLEAMKIDFATDSPAIYGWNENGEFFVDLSLVSNTDKWKRWYTEKLRTQYADKTAMVQRIIASKGRSI